MPSPRVLRVSLIVVGLAAATYGTASLTGGWLGTPPWWTTARTFGNWSLVVGPERADGFHNTSCSWSEEAGSPWHEPRASDPFFGGGVVAAGLVLSTFGAWPWRRRPTATT